MFMCAYTLVFSLFLYFVATGVVAVLLAVQSQISFFSKMKGSHAHIGSLAVNVNDLLQRRLYDKM